MLRLDIPLVLPQSEAPKIVLSETVVLNINQPIVVGYDPVTATLGHLNFTGAAAAPVTTLNVTSESVEAAMIHGVHVTEPENAGKKGNSPVCRPIGKNVEQSARDGTVIVPLPMTSPERGAGDPPRHVGAVAETLTVTEGEVPELLRGGTNEIVPDHPPLHFVVPAPTGFVTLAELDAASPTPKARSRRRPTFETSRFFSTAWIVTLWRRSVSTATSRALVDPRHIFPGIVAARQVLAAVMVCAGLILYEPLMYPASPSWMAPKHPLTSQTCSLEPLDNIFSAAVLFV
jgi:hypothetical protein